MKLSGDINLALKCTNDWNFIVLNFFPSASSNRLRQTSTQLHPSSQKIVPSFTVSPSCARKQTHGRSLACGRCDAFHSVLQCKIESCGIVSTVCSIARPAKCWQNSSHYFYSKTNIVTEFAPLFYSKTSVVTEFAPLFYSKTSIVTEFDPLFYSKTA
jgi:hypothetical protein